MLLSRLHLETDAPYLMPKNAGLRGKPNEPANLPWVAAGLADLLQRDVAQIVQACTANSRRMFGLPSIADCA
ncbi:TatD family hydrolase [Variovorax boronicumulans]|uniref:TatD family hydrolase n=1 Tax=Variovorax boronicumulans TaxID=436515 RepID=UPI00351FC5B1